MKMKLFIRYRFLVGCLYLTESRDSILGYSEPSFRENVGKKKDAIGERKTDKHTRVHLLQAQLALVLFFYNFDTVQEKFTKLGRNIKHDQTTCRDLERSLHLDILRNYSPL